jgi:DNA-binding MarR family transcriptional regulator
MKALGGSVGFLLARTARGMKRALDTRLSQHDITATQYIVLLLLQEQDGISLSKLGHCLHFDNPTITGIIDRMERDGLVERRRIADDRRVINIFMTHAGRELIEDNLGIADEIDNLAMNGITAKEKADFLKVLDRIWKTIDEKID